MRFKVLGCFKIGNKALQTVLCISEGVMAMAMEPMLAAQVGKLGLDPGLLEVPNILVEWLKPLRQGLPR